MCVETLHRNAMGDNNHNEFGEQLTDSGILTDHPDVTIVDYTDVYGEPWQETEESVIFLDQSGHEWEEWMCALSDVDRSEFSEKMNELAREHTDNDGIDRLGSAYPIVFDARTFDYN